MLAVVELLLPVCFPVFLTHSKLTIFLSRVILHSLPNSQDQLFFKKLDCIFDTDCFHGRRRDEQVFQLMYKHCVEMFSIIPNFTGFNSHTRMINNRSCL